MDIRKALEQGDNEATTTASYQLSRPRHVDGLLHGLLDKVQLQADVTLNPMTRAEKNSAIPDQSLEGQSA